MKQINAIFLEGGSSTLSLSWLIDVRSQILTNIKQGDELSLTALVAGDFIKIVNSAINSKKNMCLSRDKFFMLFVIQRIDIASLLATSIVKLFN